MLQHTMLHVIKHNPLPGGTRVLLLLLLIIIIITVVIIVIIIWPRLRLD